MTACSLQNEESDLLQESSLSSLEERSASSSWVPLNLDFPENTLFEYTAHSITFTLPEPYYLLGIDVNGVFHRSADGTGGVTCTCTSGSGGCSPVHSGGDYGCLMSTCESCDKSNSIKGVDAEIKDFVIMNPDGSGFVTAFSHLDGKRLLPPAFLDAPEVVRFLEDLDELIPPTSPNAAHKVVFINAYGYVLPVEVPSDIDDTSVAFHVGGSGDSDLTCSCNSPSGDCPRRKKFTVTYCDAENCQSCTMAGLVVNGDGEVRYFSIDEQGRISVE